MAETRAQRRLREQEEQAASTLAAEPEAEPSTPFDIPGEPGDTPEQQEESISTSAVERDEQPRREEGVEIPVEDNTLTDLSPLQATKEELLKWQKQDPTLAWVQMLVPNEQEQMNMERVYFYQKDGLIYQHWHPWRATADSVRSCLVLPEKCRALVLRIAHDVPTGGHLGITKTKDRILQRYYWPGAFQDITEYCKTCEVCQRSRGRRPARAPMLPMPLIQKPFTRIAMDLIGPLPKTKRGNQYILTICDYATRYPEAIPLSSTEAPKIAKELILLFSRVRIPEEILTDQGANFMSTMLNEVYHTLQITRIRTTPYHPQTDGLVERFNGTLKSMLRKFTSQNQKDWDEYLPYLLFSYREAPQETTGFSPFELLYGHRVRGPLDVLRDSWTGERSEEIPVAAHVIRMRDQLQEMTDLVQEKAVEVQKKQKRCYDKGSKERELKVDDEVLVLLPEATNKLKLEWVGPYRISRKTSPVDYEVETPGRRKEKKIYHINLLKRWNPPSPLKNAFLAIMVGESEADPEPGDIIPWDWNMLNRATDQFETPDLTKSERQQLLRVIQELEKVLGPAPGRTTVIEHSINTAEEVPIHQKPYRVPYSKREVVKAEIQKMLEAKIIRPSTTIVLVEKKDGTVWFCVDYRKLNQLAKFDAYPMPRIEEVLDSIGSAM